MDYTVIYPHLPGSIPTQRAIWVSFQYDNSMVSGQSHTTLHGDTVAMCATFYGELQIHLAIAVTPLCWFHCVGSALETPIPTP